ncbi:amino acid/polyamine/organocation transporter (APC superfamily) [Nocardiopsis sp. Huas11]|uniref:APC family permease n=1 Tax=Nocardiopsis sp. Huas11 TaxID=2183912 RepID=UPI000F1AA7B8|nr:APC family permease [Nocardiopsis sp. Huas11]RKS10788.1 amino acid/polyamine/organocation transporter (APC superfamily) [Nocardiopsis sp. Huas11]
MTADIPSVRQEPQLRRALGTLDSYALGFGAMIGFGWVVLTGGWLEAAGTLGTVIALVSGGLIMVVVGLVYAELTSAMPKAGGEHHYMMRGLGARWAFVGSWGVTGGYIAIVAFEAVALPRTIGYVFPQIDQGHLWSVFGSDVYLVWALIGSVSALVITAINYAGIKAAGLAQTFVVLFLVIVGVLLIFGSGMNGSVAHMEPFFTGTAGLFTVLIVVPFLFVGFDVIPQTAEELRMSPRKVGRLIVVSVVIATLWYVVVALTTASSMPLDELLGSELATADAMGALFDSRFMAHLLIAGGIAGIITSWIAMMIGASRLMYAMGRSGMLPRWFGRVHPRFRTPSNAIVFIGAISIVAPFLGEGALGWLVDSGSPSIVLTYLMVCVVFLVLRRKEPGMERPFSTGAGRLGFGVGVLGLVLTVGLLALYIPGMPASIHPVSYLIFGAWWLLGLVFVLRIPRGVHGGVDAEERLLDALRRRRSG